MEFSEEYQKGYAEALDEINKHIHRCGTIFDVRG